MSTTLRRLLLFAFGSLLLPAWVLAEHEVDHRYNVAGFVLDDSRRPLANSAVSIRMGNDTIGHQKTNSQGYYNMRLHLHDADLGRRLLVKSETGEATITVTFTPGDNATRRVHYANLIGGKLVEEPLSRSRYSVWIYVAPVAVVLLLYVAYVTDKRRKRARKREFAKQQRQTKKARR